MASRESSSSSTSSSIDLAARVLDLSRILAEIAASDAPVNSAVAIGSQLIRQLARGGICDEEFKYCTDLIQNKAFPNEYGLQLRSKILSSQTKIGKIGGLQCHVYYSIARMMALDDKFCYVVTAVASIMAFHELTFAVECLSNFALGENLDHSHGIQNPYDVRKSRIKPVILEIVKDIAHNIVNAGRELEQLPEELSVPANCNHVVEANVFSAAISTLQKLSGDAVLMTDVLYVDLMLWILNHYHGEIEVAIAGKICFNRSSKRATIKLTFIVRDVCDPATLEHASGLTPHIKISVGKGHFSKPVLDINSEGDQVRGNLSSTTRHELYDIAYLAKPTVKGFWSRGILNSSELMDIEATAQFLCKWLVNVPLVPIDMWNEEPGHGEWKYKGFRAPLSNPQDCSFNIKTLLSRWPDFLRHEYGLKQPLVVFKPLDIPEDIDIVDYTANPSSGPHDFEEIYKVLECFPPVKEVLRGVKQRCKRSECPDCVKDEGHEKFGTGKPGCLVEMAITALFTLVAQVIAEGFGAESASGLQDPTNLKHYVSKLLRELAFHEIVLWDTWLSVAAAVYLGCPWGQIDFDTGSGSGASCTSAVQYGSLIMAANWADITVEQKIERCFGVNFAIGCHLDGVQEDFAVIQCEQSGVQNISDDPTSQRGMLIELVPV